MNSLATIVPGVTPSVRQEVREAYARAVLADTSYLIYRRLQAHLSQLELADRLGVSVSAVRAWEQGLRRPTGSLAIRLAKELHIDLPDLS